MHLDDLVIARLGYIDGFAKFVSPLEKGRVETYGSATLTISGASSGFFNTVFVNSSPGRPGDMRAGIEAIRATGLPFNVRLAIGHDDHLTGMVNAMGLTEREERSTPAMVMRPIVTDDPDPGIDIRSGPGTFADHLDLVAAGFAMDIRLVNEVMSPVMTSLDWISFYAAYVDGEPAATGLGLEIEDVIAVFSVATDERFRGRGLGGAVTQKIVADAKERGCTAATLQSSAMGHHLYERLGFRTIVEYDMWTAPAAA